MQGDQSGVLLVLRMRLLLQPLRHAQVELKRQHRLQWLRKKAHRFGSFDLATAPPEARTLLVDIQTQYRVSMHIELLQRLFQVRLLLKAESVAHFFDP